MILLLDYYGLRIPTISYINLIVGDDERESTGAYCFNFTVSEFELFKVDIFIEIGFNLMIGPF